MAAKIPTGQGISDEDIDAEQLLQTAQKAGFDSIEGFVKANLKLLPKWRREVFQVLEGID